MPKSSKKMAEARVMALSLARRREHLRTLVRKAKKEGEMTDERRLEIESLVEKVSRLKEAISSLGFNPNAAAAGARVSGKKPKKRKSKGKKIKSGGVGMYGLGNSVKVWK